MQRCVCRINSVDRVFWYVVGVKPREVLTTIVARNCVRRDAIQTAIEFQKRELLSHNYITTVYDPMMTSEELLQLLREHTMMKVMKGYTNMWVYDVKTTVYGCEKCNNSIEYER
jgi:hypothetical protein